jgi:PHD/YefM family antitoxin component YafN of YafNO toxin-antitoxin module
MKRILIAAMIVVLTLSACGNSQYDDGQADPGSGGRGSVDIISDFNRFAKEADNPSDVKERLDLLMENTDTEHSDILVREYLDYLAQVLASSKAYEKESMEKAGFKFISSEGLEQMVIDYHFMDAYSEKLSPEMIDFKEFMVLNSDQPWAVDGSLVITHSQLADRIVLGEKFLTSYPALPSGSRCKPNTDITCAASLQGWTTLRLYQTTPIRLIWNLSVPLRISLRIIRN